MNSTTTLLRDRDYLLAAYRTTRRTTEVLAQPLSAEDQCVQSMPDASPTKWHRAHTTWFFETFVLVPDAPDHRVVDDRYAYLFNSYYDAVGARHTRAERGLLTRPTCAEIGLYRERVDRAVEELIQHASPKVFASIADRIELGIHHEQQHQELLLMDIKHALSRNSFDPRYALGAIDTPAATSVPLRFDEQPGGIVDIGAHGPAFSFDNEGPAHTALVQPFRLANRLATCGEWKAFIADGGYDRVELWLSDGWGARQREGWTAPLYWEHDGSQWTTLTMHGRRPVADDEPVVHVSHYEADAFARWNHARLPTEFEWESVATGRAVVGNLLDDTDPLSQPLHTTAAPADSADGPTQLFGDVWEWTASAYLPYPRFTPAAGAIGEYNGKFMANQMVLRGGSFATPAGHIRSSYRNFFYPHQRWMFSGVRLAADIATPVDTPGLPGRSAP